MKATLVVEGKEFPIEINDPELQKLIAPPKKTGYERADMRMDYYIVYGDGEIARHGDCRCQQDNEYYKRANYYSSEVVAQSNARADELMRQLRRFAVENRNIDLDWSNAYQAKWSIHYNKVKKKLEPVDCCNSRDFGTIYFDMALHAHEAITTFHDELVWYFTEYKDSL